METIFFIFKVIATLTLGSIALIVIIVAIALISEALNKRKLKKLILTPKTKEITFGNEVEIFVKGLDQKGENIEVGKVQWTTNTPNTSCNEGKFKAGQQEEVVTVTASVRQIKAETKIKVVQPIVQNPKIIPHFSQLHPGDFRQLRLLSFDQLGYKLDCQKADWRLTGENLAGSSISDSGMLQLSSQAKGSYTVTACFQDHSSSFRFYVPPVLKRLEISPQEIELDPKQKCKFTYEAFDQEQEELDLNKVTWECSSGTISKTGLFTSPSNIKTITVSVSHGKVKASAIVTVRSRLSRLSISPDNKHIRTNERLKFRVRGFDQFGEPSPVRKVRWQISQGKIAEDGTFYGLGYDADLTVTVTSGSLSHSTSLVVREPSRLTQIRIEPKSSQVLPGESQILRVIGLDQRNDEMSVSNISWEVTEGKINESGIFQAGDNQKGDCYITATVGDLVAYADIYVPPTLTRLEISPQKIELYPEQEYSFTCKGFDQQNQPLHPNYIKWKASWGGRINAKGIFRGGYSKSKVKVTAKSGNIKATVTVTLLPVLRKLKISPEDVILNPNESQQFTIRGYDQFNQEIDPGCIKWESEAGVVSETGKLTVHSCAKGEHFVIATSLSSLKFTRTPRNILLSLGITNKVLALIISPESTFREVIEIIQLLLNPPAYLNLPAYLNEVSEQQQLEASPEEETTAIDFPSDIGEALATIPEMIQDWLFETIQSRIARLFSSVGQFCLNQAKANVSCRAYVTVPAVLSGIKIEPSKATVTPGIGFQFQVIGLDQWDEEMPIMDVVEWGTTAGWIADDGTLFIDESFEIENDASVSVSAKIGQFEGIANVSVEFVEAEPELESDDDEDNQLDTEPELEFDDKNNQLDTKQFINSTFLAGYFSPADAETLLYILYPEECDAEEGYLKKRYGIKPTDLTSYAIDDCP